MNHFLEHRLLYAVSKPSPETEVADSDSKEKDTTKPAATQTPPTISQAQQAKNIEYQTILPFLGASNLLPENTAPWKKVGTEAAASLFIPGYLPAALAYNIAAPAINTGIYATRKAMSGISKPFRYLRERKAEKFKNNPELANQPGVLKRFIGSPIAAISKGIWQRIKNVSSTAWDYTSKTAQTAWKTPQAIVHGTVQATLGTVLSPVGAIGKFATGAVDVVRRATFGNINSLTNAIFTKEDPWYALSFIPKFTNWVNNGVKHTIEKGSIASNWMYTVGKAELGMAAQDIKAIAGNIKGQVANTIATPLAKFPAALAQGTEGFDKSNGKINGIVEAIRKSPVLNLFKVLSPKTKSEEFAVLQA